MIKKISIAMILFLSLLSKTHAEETISNKSDCFINFNTDISSIYNSRTDNEANGLGAMVFASEDSIDGELKTLKVSSLYERTDSEMLELTKWIAQRYVESGGIKAKYSCRFEI